MCLCGYAGWYLTWQGWSITARVVLFHLLPFPNLGRFWEDRLNARGSKRFHTGEGVNMLPVLTSRQWMFLFLTHCVLHPMTRVSSLSGERQAAVRHCILCTHCTIEGLYILTRVLFLCSSNDLSATGCLLLQKFTWVWVFQVLCQYNTYIGVEGPR